MDDNNQSNQGPSSNQNIQELERKLDELKKQKSDAGSAQAEKVVYDNRGDQRRGEAEKPFRQEPRRLVETSQANSPPAGLPKPQTHEPVETKKGTLHVAREMIGKTKTQKKSNVVFYAGIALMIASFILAALSYFL